MTIKELFDKAENGTLTWEQFEAAMGEAKFVDLSEGNYVSKNRYDDQIGKLNAQIQQLQSTISTRDTDLAQLQQTIKDAGDIDALKTASQELSELQKRYDKETKSYQAQLAKQAYEFAVKDFANTKTFSSKAAKRDFIQSMIAKGLTLENGRIIGAEDFVQMYSEDNSDAFMTKQTEPKPQFTAGTEPKKPAKLSLSDMMKMKNENPDITFDL